MLGKWKATVQFVAIALAMLRPDVTIAGAYLDQWAMVIAAVGHGVVGHRLPGAFVRRAALGSLHEPRVRHRRQRRDRQPRWSGGWSRAATRSSRWPAAGGRRAALERRGAAGRAATLEEEAALRGMQGCELAFNVAGINTLCVADPAPMQRVNVDGAGRRGARRRARPASRGSSTPPRPPRSASRRGRSAPSRRCTVAGICRPTSGPRPRASARRSPPRETLGQDLVCVNPSSVQGPGRAGGTGRFLLAFLDGRLKVFVHTNVSLVDIADCVEGHLLAAEHGAAGERYLLSGITLTITEALTLAAEVAGVRRRAAAGAAAGGEVAAADVVERGFRLLRPPAAGLPGDGPHAAARPPLRRLARRRASWGCATRTRAIRCAGRSTGPGREGLLRNV